MSLTDYIAPDGQLGQHATEREILRPEPTSMPLADAAAALMSTHWRTPLNALWHSRMAEAIAAEVPDLMARVAENAEDLTGIARRMGEALIEEARKLRLGDGVAQLEALVAPRVAINGDPDGYDAEFGSNDSNGTA